MSESTNPHPSTSFSASFLNHPVVPGDEERLSDVFLAAADVRAALARFNTTLESISAQPRNRILERITENFHEVLVSLTSTVTASKKVLQSMLNHDEELKQLLHHQQQQSPTSDEHLKAVVSQAVATELAKLPTQLTKSDVQKIVQDSLASHSQPVNHRVVEDGIVKGLRRMEMTSTVSISEKMEKACARALQQQAYRPMPPPQQSTPMSLTPSFAGGDDDDVTRASKRYRRSESRLSDAIRETIDLEGDTLTSFGEGPGGSVRTPTPSIRSAQSPNHSWEVVTLSMESNWTEELSADSQRLVTSAMNEPDVLRRSIAAFSSSKRRCLRTTIKTKLRVDWPDVDGPCDGCRKAKAECIIFKDSKTLSVARRVDT